MQDLEAVPPNKFELTPQIRFCPFDFVIMMTIIPTNSPRGAVLMLRRIKYFAQKKQMKKVNLWKYFLLCQINVEDFSVSDLGDETVRCDGHC